MVLEVIMALWANDGVSRAYTYHACLPESVIVASETLSSAPWNDIFVTGVVLGVTDILPNDSWSYRNVGHHLVMYFFSYCSKVGMLPVHLSGTRVMFLNCHVPS